MAYITKKTTVNGVKPIGSNLFGTCSTAGGTAQKDVVMADFDVLVSGVTIHVYFANKNTASNPTLKVGSTSAIAISCNGASEGNWEDGAVISFTYNGSNWIQNDVSESGATYTLSKSGDTITLTGSDGSTSSVTDSDTILKYTADAPDGATTNNVVQNDVENNVASGGYSLAEGIGTTASGLYSHAEGQGTTASGDRSHAEGNGSTASGHSSRAEGNGTVASGNHSHAEGNASVASGSGSHAEGSHTEASSDHSHAEGFYTVASGNRSFAGNNRTIAQRADQTVIGRMNIADTQGADGGELGKYAFIIGNGNADDDRSNALTVDWNGNVDIASGAEYKIGGTAITDHVIEQGTDGIWTYRKWASGIAECWGRGSASLTSYVHVGSFYGYRTTFAFPVGLFIAVPTHTYTASVGNALAMPASGTSTTASEMAVYALCINSGTQSCVFDMVAKGKWK